MSAIIVSVCCLAYNHEPYIRQCLDGFIMQKIDFALEVLIHDDASTDNTANIIREYEEKYPDIIKPIYQSENQYSKGVGVTRKFNFSRAKGKYIAMCEGDDYWTDPHKLQKQVDFLDSNNNVALASHNVQIVGQEFNATINRPYYSDRPTGFYGTIDLITGFKLPTNSIVFRNELYNFNNAPEWSKKIRSGDKFLYLMISQFGTIYYDNTVMAAYSKHPEGAVGSYENWDLKKHIDIHLNQIFFWENFKIFFYPKHQKEIRLNISNEAFQIAFRSLKQGIYSKVILKYIRIAIKNDNKKIKQILSDFVPIIKKDFEIKKYQYKIRFLILGSKVKQQLLRLFN